jgi:uncharacterized protein YjbI with pentapeptide repeats
VAARVLNAGDKRGASGDGARSSTRCAPPRTAYPPGRLVAGRRLRPCGYPARRPAATRAADLTGQALEAATRLVLDAGWLLLLLTAFGLAGGLALSSPRGRATTHWLRRRLRTRPVLVGAAAAGLLAVLVLVVLVLPPLLGGDDRTDQNNVRTTLLQGFAALLILTGAAIGAAVTLRQVRTTREGQITDRYTKAVDQLGSQHLDVRLGGIYALERIARDSPPDRPTIEEVLTAFIRSHAPWPPPPTLPSPQAIIQRLVTFAQRQRSAVQRGKGAESQRSVLQRGKGAEPHRPATDVQAALTVLGRRELPPDYLEPLYVELPPDPSRRPLDLTRVDLRGAELGGTNLQGVRLAGANLEGADLGWANLQEALLHFANIQGAWLAYANLQDVSFRGANLQDVSFRGANLRLARFGDVDLQGVSFRGADLRGAYLGGISLQDAWLTDAKLQRAELGEAKLQRAKLDGANLQNANLGNADLRDAILGGANLQDANLGGANLQGARADEGTRWPAGWDRAKAEARGVQYGYRRSYWERRPPRPGSPGSAVTVQRRENGADRSG